MSKQREKAEFDFRLMKEIIKEYIIKKADTLVIEKPQCQPKNNLLE